MDQPALSPSSIRVELEPFTALRALRRLLKAHRYELALSMVEEFLANESVSRARPESKTP